MIWDEQKIEMVRMSTHNPSFDAKNKKYNVYLYHFTNETHHEKIGHQSFQPYSAQNLLYNLYFIYNHRKAKTKAQRL